jgi:predicted glutamine amidotransferase
MFAHNGSVFGFEDLRPHIVAATPPDLVRQLRGSTDSELIFYYLLGAMRSAGRPLDAPVQPRIASAAIRHALGRLFEWAEALGHPPPKVSFVLTDGRHLLAQRGGMELHLSATAGTLRVSSEPIDDQRWLLIPEGCMVVGTPSRILHITKPPDGFRVTWSEPLSPPPVRPNVVCLAA